MEIEDIVQEVNKIFIDVLDDADIVLTKDTVAEDIDEWDSLNHIQLVVAIEKHFKVRFTSSEIQKWQNVGEMCISIKGKHYN